MRPKPIELLKQEPKKDSVESSEVGRLDVALLNAPMKSLSCEIRRSRQTKRSKFYPIPIEREVDGRREDQNKNCGLDSSSINTIQFSAWSPLH